MHSLEKCIYLIPEVVPFILLGTNVECLAMYETLLVQVAAPFERATSASR